LSALGQRQPTTPTPFGTETASEETDGSHPSSCLILAALVRRWSPATAGRAPASGRRSAEKRSPRSRRLERCRRCRCPCPARRRGPRLRPRRRRTSTRGTGRLPRPLNPAPLPARSRPGKLCPAPPRPKALK
jgi:hypothetical protein